MGCMEDFEIETTINKGRTVVFIGRINGIAAILETKHPRATMANIDDYIQRDHRVILSNDVYQTGEVDVLQEVEYILTYPASDEDVRKAGKTCRYVSETYDEYLVKKAGFGTCWMDEIAESPELSNGRRFESKDFLVVNDRDWDGSAENPSLLLIFRGKDYQTVRDVDDPGLVVEARRLIIGLFQDLGVGEQHVCMYFDLRPECTRLHIRAVSIARRLPAPSFGGWVVLVDNLIKNLSIDRDYYRKELYLIETQ